MFKITLKQYVTNEPKPKLVEVLVPALPREGDFIDHEPSRISGYVRKSAIFYWGNNGEFEVEVKVQ